MKFNEAQGQAILEEIEALNTGSALPINATGQQVADIINKYYIPDDGSAPQWLKDQMEAVRKLPLPTKEKVAAQFRAVEEARKNGTCNDNNRSNTQGAK